MSHYYLISGIFLLLISLLLVRRCEGNIFAPASWFYFGYFVHTYTDLVMRIETDSYLDINALPTMMLFNITSNVLLLVFYSLYFLVKRSLNLDEVRALEFKVTPYRSPVLTQFEFNFAFVSIVCISILIAIIFISTGSLEQDKGAVAYGGGGRYFRLAQSLAYVFCSLVPAIIISSFGDGRKKPYKEKAMSAIAFGLVALYSMSSFGRQTILFVLLVSVILYNSRVSNIKAKNLIAVGIVFLIVNIFSVLRTTGMGLLSLSMDDISTVYHEGGSLLSAVFNLVFKILPGQAVFSNTIGIMETKEYFYGITYIESVGRALLPDFLSPIIQGDTPANWYKQEYAPYLQGHGFDFGMEAEAYMNFGMFGTIVFAVLGLILAKVSSLARKSPSPAISLWAAIMIVNLIVGLRNDSYSIAVRTIYFAIPYIAVKVLSYFLYWSLNLTKRNDCSRRLISHIRFRNID